MHNTSTVSLDTTARAHLKAAQQRADNLAILGAKSVLELCVGPSLRTLEGCYQQHGISVTGNDIDSRWLKYYPQGSWLLGDARSLDTSGYDAVVIAPPLSKGCTGRRTDALSLFDVQPRYDEFLHKTSNIVVFVLPGKTLTCDVADLHKFVGMLYAADPTRVVEVVPLVVKCTKYVDVYWYK